jgi:hypothetical protein
LPPSAFNALWAESFPADLGQPWGVIWLADPRDIGSRQAVVRFDNQEIFQAALSSDGRQVAFTAAGWKQGASPLWVVNLDGTSLRQLAPNATQVFWSRDGRTLVYTVAELDRGYVGIDQANLTTGEITRLLPIEADTEVTLLGWSTNGRKVYYLHRAPGREYELWVIEPDGHSAYPITSLGAEMPPYLSLSPDGSKFLIGTPQGLVWMSADGRTQQNIPVSSWKQRCGLFWSNIMDEIVICQLNDQRPIEHIRTLNIQTGASSELGSLEIPPNGNPFGSLAISPDNRWMTAYVYLDGFYWIHLSTGTIVPIPSQNRRVFFVAWVPKGVAER